MRTSENRTTEICRSQGPGVCIILNIHQKVMWKIEFSFLLLSVYIFKNCSSQFLSHYELAEPVFCSEELSFLLYKNKNKSLVLSSVLGGKIQLFTILLYVENYTWAFLPQIYLYSPAMYYRRTHAHTRTKKTQRNNSCLSITKAHWDYY